jgi:hypothetical protein
VSGVWQINDERKNKYLVLRRDATMPEWPWLVLGAADPAVPHAIRALATASRVEGMDSEYVSDLFDLADKFDAWRQAHAAGDPDAGPHRVDHPAVVSMLNLKKSEAL